MHQHHTTRSYDFEKDFRVVRCQCKWNYQLRLNKEEAMSKFNEATRVQMPAMVHLTRLGYSYFGKISEDMAGTVYDPDTNILTEVFKTQFFKLIPSA